MATRTARWSNYLTPRSAQVAGLGLLIATHIALLWAPLHVDEGIYIYLADRLLAGEALYVDYFYAKPPLVPALLAGVFALSNSVLTARVVVLLTNLGIAGLLYTLGREHARPVGTAAAALYLGGVIPYLGYALFTDQFMVLFVLLGIVCVRRAARTDARWWLVVGGVAIGAATLARQVGVLGLPTVGLAWLLLGRTEPRRILTDGLLLSAGWAVAVGSTLLVVAWLGWLPAMLEQTIFLAGGHGDGVLSGLLLLLRVGGSLPGKLSTSFVVWPLAVAGILLHFAGGLGSDARLTGLDDVLVVSVILAVPATKYVPGDQLWTLTGLVAGVGLLIAAPTELLPLSRRRRLVAGALTLGVALAVQPSTPFRFVGFGLLLALCVLLSEFSPAPTPASSFGIAGVLTMSSVLIINQHLHYFLEIVPFAALAGAAPLVAIASGISPSSTPDISVSRVAVAVCVVLATPVVGSALGTVTQPGIEEDRRVVDALDEHVEADDTILVYGTEPIYYYWTDRRAYDENIYHLPVNLGATYTNKQLTAIVAAGDVDYVLLSGICWRGTHEPVCDYVRANAEPVVKLSGSQDDKIFELYRTNRTASSDSYRFGGKIASTETSRHQPAPRSTTIRSGPKSAAQHPVRT